MADNYLERQYAEYERKKAEAKCPGKKKKPSDRKKFFTRPVITKTHEERQREIEQELKSKPKE